MAVKAGHATPVPEMFFSNSVSPGTQELHDSRYAPFPRNSFELMSAARLEFEP